MNLSNSENQGKRGGAGRSALANAWAARADKLAAWTWDRLVNRPDAWGGYRPEEEIGKEYVLPDGTKGKLGSQTTRKGNLTLEHLARHFAAKDRTDLVGLHSTSTTNTSLWGALDVDWHGQTSTPAAVNWAAALAWYSHLCTLGFHPLLTESNGAGGFHLRVLFAEPVPTPRVFHFLQSLVRDHGKYGMPRPPELFPKQPLLRPRPDGKPGFGNWLRLPGRHHNREHWSRVWDGARWLEGHDAIDFMLALRGDAPELVPAEPPPSPPRSPRRYQDHPIGQGGNLVARIAAYLRRLPNLGEGQGRDDVAYHFAAFLCRDLALAEDVALDWLRRWDQGNNPPKGEAALREILANALRYGRNLVGCGRDRDRTKSLVLPGRRPGHFILRCQVEVY
jgi:hypothetical protein